MQFHPDPASPVPLYHQIAEALRYRIATGALTPGTTLPALREAAARWNVNLHTVRQAYRQLEQAGLVSTVPPRGSVVLPSRQARQGKLRKESIDEFLAGVLR